MVAGFDFIEKPVDFEVLRSKLASILGRQPC